MGCRNAIFPIAAALVLAMSSFTAAGADTAAVSAAAASLPLSSSQSNATEGVRFVVGNDLWQPGKSYRNSMDWLALNCTRDGCAFEPAKLTVRAEKWQGHYDDDAQAGQKLAFAKGKPGPGKVVAWFQPDAKYPWLKPGPVTTYASSAMRIKRPATEGTLELAVDLPNGQQATLVPLLDRSQDLFRLQLRTPARRQMLGSLGGCSRMVSVDYLLWAGDFDGDGRPDYLISFVDAEGEVLLYLGGAAAANDLVGIAGIYEAPPYGGECDGEGWLVR